MAATEGGEAAKGLQKSYSFDNVAFAQGEITCDAKDVGHVQKAMAQLAGEMTADMAKFTADDVSHTVKKAGPMVLVESGMIDKLKTMIEDNKTMENALICVESLARVCGTVVEPLVMPFLPAILRACAHKKNEVRALAEEAGPALMTCACPWAIKAIQVMLFEAIKDTKWQSKVWGLVLLGQLADKYPEAFAKTLAVAVPVISEAMWDTKAQVKTVATKTMEFACAACSNRDIKPFVPELIKAIQSPEEVPETVHKLSATVFVQSVDSPALSITVPILLRGCQEKKTEIKRKVAVIVDNMSKLIDDAREAKPFLPELMPGIERLANELSDPEARGVANKALKTLQKLQETIDAEEEQKAMPPEVCMAAILETISATAPSMKVTDPTIGAYLEYVATMVSGMVADLYFDDFEWKFVAVCPYLAPFLSEGDAVAICTALQARCYKDAMPKEHAEDEDEEGEDLCNCEFSLGYGAKILLNNTRLHLKRGKRYGICGYNGCGKSTLMRAIANGQVDGFPPKDVLKTVYVEHDIQSSQENMSIVEYVVDMIPERTKEDIVKCLTEFGFVEDPDAPACINAKVTGLSGGWKMKLSLARAMLMNADILLLDEPTNHLDVANVAWLENYLTSLTTVTSCIVTHDSGFLDRVVTHIIHYEDNRKLKNYKGNLSAFVKRVPRAKSYYELTDENLSFSFPEPGLLDGVKSKGKAIIKMDNCTYTYPGKDKPTVRNVNLQACLASRVAVIGPNGAGKSTIIKMFCGESKPQCGTIWRHQNMRIAYVAQHAFHHLEKHLDETPNEYIQWRYSSGEDRESNEQESKKLTAEEEADMQKVHVIRSEDGTVQKLVVEALRSRRKAKRTYEYEVKWLNKSEESNTWLTREKLEEMGWAKMVQRLDQQEALRLGLAARPLTTKFVEKQLGDMGLEAEFATHSRIRGLSGGQKVKVVIAGAMWNNPHILVMDEPTNYLDRDSLGALAGAIRKYGGGVVLISHNREFTDQLCPERWVVENGLLKREGEVAADEKIDLDANQAPDEVTDSLGNVIKVKKEKKLTAREQKKLEKKKAERRKAGLPSDSEEEW
jgi:elongation factor 3